MQNYIYSDCNKAKASNYIKYLKSYDIFLKKFFWNFEEYSA